MKCDGCGADVLEQAACPDCGARLAPALRGPRLPDEPWELTAPESYLLRYGLGDKAPAYVFWVALMELVARGAFGLDGVRLRRRWGPAFGSVWLLGDGPKKARVDEPALAPVIALHTGLIERRPRFGVALNDHTTEHRGVPLERFVRVARRRNGGFRSYMERDVAGSLRRRGLLSTRNERTPAGERADHQLDAWLQLSGAKLARWSHDRTWLCAYLSGAGAAVFLAGIAHPGHKPLQTIGRSLSAPAPPDQTFAFTAEAWNAGNLDFAALAENLAGSFGVFDPGFLGGGGDGGGGDGGGA